MSRRGNSASVSWNSSGNSASDSVLSSIFGIPVRQRKICLAGHISPPMGSFGLFFGVPVELPLFSACTSMDSVKYIGMDVHKDTISIAVLNSSGKLVMCI